MVTQQVKFISVDYGNAFTTHTKNGRNNAFLLTCAVRYYCAVPNSFAPSAAGEGASQSDDADTQDNSLENLVRQEREDARRRLRGELKREPTEEELDEWLRQHTEGY